MVTLVQEAQKLQMTVTSIIIIAAVYTCWLKPIVGVKNLAVAITRAASLVAGAFATGMVTPICIAGRPCWLMQI